MKKFLIILSIIAVVLILAFQLYLKKNLLVVNGYAAKNLCSCVFIAGLDEEMVKNVDLGFSFIGMASTEVDYDAKTTTSNVFGMVERKAVYREGLGCVVLNELNEELLAGQTFNPTLMPDDSLANWFERVDTVDVITDEQAQNLSSAMAMAFENDEENKVNTRAVVVLYKGQLVGEQYAEGVTKDTRLLGWSMTKSLTSTMAGLLIRDSVLTLNEKANVEEWQGTPKEDITLRNLLQMSSGLQFEESYGSYSDANIMLWISDTMGIATVDNPLEADPGTKWYYSSGTTNLLMKLMRESFPEHRDYLDYMNKELYGRIGAYTMMIEPDGAGNFVGSSFGWASARDWARVGQLYLNNGTWGGEQILPSSWVEFVRQEPDDPKAQGRYGAQFWLNKTHPGLPEDAYYMNGFHGQRVMIIPSKQMVVVRLGVTYDGRDFDFDTYVNGLINAIEK